MCAAISDVRFTPNSDRESRHPQRVMSALPLKADMCGATSYVGYGPKADKTKHARIDVQQAKASGHIFLSFCCTSWWALMNLSAKRDDPPGTVAGTLVI
jgi:hypothetical protein